MKKWRWLALLAMAALVLSLGGCGGGSSGSSSGSSSSGSSPSGKTYTGSNGSVTATDGTVLTVTSASLTVGTISSTGSVAVAASSTTATFNCTLSNGTSSQLYSKSGTVTVTQSGTDWTFAFTDGLKVVLDTSSNLITLDGTMPSVTVGSTTYTLTNDFKIDVSEGSSGGGGGDDSSGSGGGGVTSLDVSNAITIVLKSDGTATYNGTAVPQANWVWSMDLGVDHWQGGNNTTYNFVKNSPAEFYIGTKPTDSLYIAHDIVYLPEAMKSSFTNTAKNDNETVYTCNYTDSVIADSITKVRSDYSSLTKVTNCIFAAMDYNPAQNASAAKMLHSASDAYANPVLHIKGAGTYILQGTWNGQIWFEAENEDVDSVKVILNGVTVTCGVGPAIIFTDFYECDTAQTGAYDVSSYMENAGVKVYLSDGTTNTFTGANLPRILRVRPKEDTTTTIDGSDVDQQKKRYKWDGAFHSRVSTVINGGNYDGSASSGTGKLIVTSTTCEGLDAEMHLTIDGGAITVSAPDDAINVNEDNVSVFTMNAGTLNVTSTTNGDGIDSNGWIVLNGGSGTITSEAGGAEQDMDAVLGIYDNTNGAFSYSSVENEQGGGNVTSTGGAPGGGGTPGGDVPSGDPNGGNNPGGEPPSGTPGGQPASFGGPGF